jgi:hypothetical protein
MGNLHHLFVETFNKGYACGFEDCFICFGLVALAYIIYRIIKRFTRI